MGFAQRRLARRLAGIDFSPGKGDLAGMGPQVRSPLGEQHGQAAGAGDDRREHSGRARKRQHVRARGGPVKAKSPTPARPLEARRGRVRARASSRQRAQSVGIEIGRAMRGQRPSISLIRHIGKKTPRDRTPNQASSRQVSVVPSATRS